MQLSLIFRDIGFLTANLTLSMDRNYEDKKWNDFHIYVKGLPHISLYDTKFPTQR